MAGKISATTESEATADFASNPVPLTARMPRGPLTMAWWGVCSAMFYLVVAGTLAHAYGARNALIGIILSVAAYGVINGVLSRYAIRTGLSVALFSRSLFGTVGAAIATVIFFATAVYYAIFEGSVMAVALNATAPAISYPVAAFIVVVYSVVLIFGSVQNWLDKLNGVLLPLYLIGLVVAVALTVSEYGYSNAWLDVGPDGGAPASGWWDCFVAFMGVWILMMYTFDYARFGRPQDATYHARFNFGIPFYVVTFLLNGIVGIFLATTIKIEGAVSEVSVVLALLKLMGIAGLAFVWVTQTRINTANFYLGTVNLEALIEQLTGLRAGKIVCGILIGLIVYSLMLADVFSYLLLALAYQGIFVVGWVGIALVHIAITRKGLAIADTDAMVSTSLPAWNVRGVTAWFGSTIMGIILLNGGSTFSSFSAPATFLVSMAAYWLLAGSSLRTASTATAA
ncbi:allantoin permease [Microvirga sp. KLBC 81]|uniref:purine-cytosine permease family protein n=1 Tax=Microvirga sp. KLBC 81 TaxID=1862707 RepID=UPI000D51AD44|nr:cytosine permease [Microvirga sp. KLBC 81]PVE20950.1 allantoin permease [Microvirga sp. KLBC 81]